jgi:hypothetical protein
MDKDTGDDNVFIGEGPFPHGSGNVVIRPGGPGGHVRIGGGVAIGRGAQADETSTALGSGARAGGRATTMDARWWNSPWTVTLIAGTLAAVTADAVLSLLHLR